MALNMKFVLSLTFFYFICLISKTRSQLQPIIDGIIRANATGIDYPDDIIFLFYSRDNRNDPDQLMVDNLDLLKQSSYDTSKPTKFVTHGLGSSAKDDVCVFIRHGLLQHGDYNVIVIDWSSYADKNVISASIRAKPIGIYISKMIKFLIKQGSDVKQMSLIGHSLGAHVMGAAGYELSPKAGHLVGLDPAGPGFGLNDESDRIDRTDADYTEIVHTNAGIRGIASNVGHVDYWPNGGSLQPGCSIDIQDECNHLRSYIYYAEALENPDSFYGVLCDTYDEFLEGKCKTNPIEPFPNAAPMPEKPEGTYMLRTASSYPFGLGREGAKPEG